MSQMNTEKVAERYIAFLRGINVGGHHKIPMTNLCKVFEKLGCKNVLTILNTGNIIFDSFSEDLEDLEKMISEKLENTFGFQVPTIIRKSKTIVQLFKDTPFQDVLLTKDIRLYVSFLKNETRSDVVLPWISPDHSYKIMEKKDRIILSILDLSISKTPITMKAFENFFGKDNTTRNWKTIERIVRKL